jgi:hypothetical protein
MFYNKRIKYLEFTVKILQDSVVRLLAKDINATMDKIRERNEKISKGIKKNKK